MAFMTEKNIILLTGEGLGNIVETLPLIATIEKNLNVKVMVVLVGCNKDYCNIFHKNKAIMYDDITQSDIQSSIGIVKTVWGNHHTKDTIGNHVLGRFNLLNDLNSQGMRLDRSEVSVYLNAASDLGIAKKDFIYNVSDYLHKENSEKFDVVICDGYNYGNTADMWHVKSYRGWKEIVAWAAGKGLSICSVGHESQYVEGTVNRTSLNIHDTIGLLNGCSIVLSNDTGVYHLASAMGKTGAVVFTFTNTTKNYDSVFHKSFKLVKRKDLDCMACCHAQRWWKSCGIGHACRDFDGKEIKNILEKYM